VFFKTEENLFILKTSYAIFFFLFGHTEICSWATSLSPISCQIRTKRLGYRFVHKKPVSSQPG
jgi:hypothetical protein